MAKEASRKAAALGWYSRVKIDQSDVVDMATTVAWKPGDTQGRWIRFVEGRVDGSGWKDREDLMYALQDHCAL